MTTAVATSSHHIPSTIITAFIIMSFHFKLIHEYKRITDKDLAQQWESSSHYLEGLAQLSALKNEHEVITVARAGISATAQEKKRKGE